MAKILVIGKECENYHHPRVLSEVYYCSIWVRAAYHNFRMNLGLDAIPNDSLNSSVSTTRHLLHLH